MTRFSCPAEVVAWADTAARSDHERHSIGHCDEDGTTWQMSANPYSTHTRRHDWQRGFDGVPPYSWERTLDYDPAYQRGGGLSSPAR